MSPDPKARLRQLIKGMQQDQQSYHQLLQLLQQQLGYLGAHDSTALARLQPQQEALMNSLARHGSERCQLLASFGLSADNQGMTTLIQRLPATLGNQIATLWQELHQQLTACQQQNAINGRLLAGQMELLRTLLQQPDAYQAYAGAN